MAKMVVLRSAYDGLSDQVSAATALVTPEPSLTQQQFTEQSDINTIVNMFLRTGEMPDSYVKPQFGDFVGASDYHSALNLVIHAQDEFDMLPARLRARFDNDPAQMLAFVADRDNLDEAIELGLIDSSSSGPLSIQRAVGTGEELPSGGSTPPKGKKASKPAQNVQNGGEEGGE